MGGFGAGEHLRVEASLRKHTRMRRGLVTCAAQDMLPTSPQFTPSTNLHELTLKIIQTSLEMSTEIVF